MGNFAEWRRERHANYKSLNAISLHNSNVSLLSQIEFISQEGVASTIPTKPESAASSAGAEEEEEPANHPFASETTIDSILSMQSPPNSLRSQDRNSATFTKSGVVGGAAPCIRNRRTVVK